MSGSEGYHPERETVVVVDERNRPVGAVTRGEMRRKRLIHRATYVLVFNSKGELFVHKRSASKDVYPAHYDVAAGGVVLAGEGWEESAVRELEEELGVSGVPLRYHFEFYHEDGANRVFGRVFSCVWDGPLRLQPEEVEEGRFMPLDEVLEMAERHPFCPDGLKVLRAIV